MDTKHKPATALPHSHEYSKTGSHLKDASGGIIGSARFEHDALYWVHAANAYPKLVEALRYAGSPAGNALLRDLGELDD